MRWPALPHYLQREDVPLPSGWSAFRLDDISDQLPVGQRRDTKSCTSDGATPVVDQSEDGFLGWHDDEPGVRASEQQPVVTFANHTCEMRVMRRPFSVIQNVFPKVGREPICSTMYFYYATKGRVRLVDYKGHHPAFRSAWIPLPPRALQDRIVNVLSAYDDLIENNTKRIKILEEMARSLYREWFVNFRFPGHEKVKMVSSPLGKVPEGWRFVPLTEVAEVAYGFAFKSKLFNDSGDGLSVVRIRDLKDDSSSTWTTEVAADRYLIGDGDVLIGMDGLFHMSKWPAGKAWLNQRVARVRPLGRGTASRYFLFLALEEPIKKLEATIVGTTVAHLSDKDFRATFVLVATEGLQTRFDELTEDIFRQEIALKKASRLLRRSRDLLLPRLISGELPVDAAEAP